MSNSFMLRTLPFLHSCSFDVFFLIIKFKLKIILHFSELYFSFMFRTLYYLHLFSLLSIIKFKLKHYIIKFKRVVVGIM